jgi:tRNA U34 5-methylaminomethyl-2-thiouridine-forming methyltransferase MnmC
MGEPKQNFTLLGHPNGTSTLVDAENGQAMHSQIGPTLESNLVYAERARIEAVLNTPTVTHVLYDVGMGTAANVIATLDRIRANASASGTLFIFSFETKPDGLRAALAHLDAFPDLRPWGATLESLLEKSESRFRIGAVDIQWRLVAGDFYTNLDGIPAPDTLYYDFYTPKSAPELWSLAALTRLREKIGDHSARLYTYAAATSVRLHLLAAGFYVGAGPSTTLKRETTIAATRFELLENPLPRSWLAKLEVGESIQGPEFAFARSRVATHPQWTLTA